MACQAPLLVRMAGQCMGLRTLFHLEIVFEATQIAIR
jgi:hypothetical protein